MTIDDCQSFCTTDYSYGLAGLLNGDTCYCGQALQSYSALGFDGCNKTCTGNSSEYCGGLSRLSVWNLTTYLAPSKVLAVGAYQLNGCYSAPNSSALLSGKSYTNATSMSAESCVGYCQGYGLSYAALANGTTCSCDSTFPSNATTTADRSCAVPCSGNGREVCGGASALDVYYYNATSVNSAGHPASQNQVNKISS